MRSCLIDKCIMKCLDFSNFFFKLFKFSTSPEKEASKPPRFYKLPFMGDYSNSISRQVSKLIRKYCKEGTNIRLIFTPFKIGSCLILKTYPHWKQMLFISLLVLAVTLVTSVRRQDIYQWGSMNAWVRTKIHTFSKTYVRTKIVKKWVVMRVFLF